MNPHDFNAKCKAQLQRRIQLDAKQQADLLEALKDMLSEHVWGIYFHGFAICNICSAPRDTIHSPDCPVGKALRVYNEVVGK